MTVKYERDRVIGGIRVVETFEAETPEILGETIRAALRAVASTAAERAAFGLPQDVDNFK